MKNKNNFYILILTLLVASFAYRFLGHAKMDQTTMLFMGLPALLSIMIVKFSNTPKSSYGVVFRTITLFLLISATLLGEGFICVVMSAPIFYAIGFISVFIINKINKERKDDDDPLDSGLFAIGIACFLTVSGLYGDACKKPIRTVSISKIITNDVSLEALNNPVDLGKELPAFFGIGFPKPVKLQGTGLEIGDIKTIQFKSTTKGIGTLNLKVKSRTPDKIIFQNIGDNSHISHWMTWNDITVSKVKLPNGGTQITWKTQYQCELGPAWYFAPIEQYAVKQSTHHLMDICFYE